MDPATYQLLAYRTQCPQPHVADSDGVLTNAALLHACLGIGGEAGELLAEMQRRVWYKKELDVTNVVEELGDVLWYVAEACNALSISMGEVMEKNIDKLKARYPEKYTDQAAQHRDLPQERAVLEGNALEITCLHCHHTYKSTGGPLSQSPCPKCSEHFGPDAKIAGSPQRGLH